MNMFSKYRLKWVFSLTLACVFSAPSRGDSAPEESVVRFRVLTVERSSGMKQVFLINPDGRSGESIRMHKNNFTGPYHAKGRKLAFSRAAATVDEKPEIIGQVTLAENLGNRVLLIAVPSAKGYAFYPVSDNLSAFGAGKSKFVNLTNTTIAGILNKQKIKLSPGATSRAMACSRESEPHSFPVEFYYAKGKKWQPFSSSYWRHEPEFRTIVFFYADPKSKRIRIRPITEVVAGATDE